MSCMLRTPLTLFIIGPSLVPAGEYQKAGVMNSVNADGNAHAMSFDEDF